MKKLLLSVGVFLASASALSAQTSIDASVIGRLDGHLSAPLNGDKSSFDFGISSFYTNVEASFGEHVDLVWVAHWAGTANDNAPFKSTPELYRNIWRSAAGWTDYAYMNLNLGNWTLRLGKDVVAIGGFEYEPWDWDCFPDQCSLLWNNMNAYNWGGSLLYSTDDECHNFQLQAISSENPLSYCECDEDDNPNLWRPWQFGYGIYAFKYDGCFGGSDGDLFHTIDSFGYMRDFKKGGRFFGTLGLGINFSDKVSASIEGMGRWAASDARFGEFSGKSFKTLAECTYTPCDKFELIARVGYEKIGVASEVMNWLEEETPDFNYVFGGLTAVYYPIKGNQDLQIKANVSSNKIFKGIYATLGVTYNHCFHIVK